MKRPIITADEKRATAIVVLLFLAIVAGLMVWETAQWLSAAVNDDSLKLFPFYY
jgi:formate/nitrite transporter FocA (FNT family)